MVCSVLCVLMYPFKLMGIADKTKNIENVANDSKWKRAKITFGIINIIRVAFADGY